MSALPKLLAVAVAVAAAALLLPGPSALGAAAPAPKAKPGGAAAALKASPVVKSRHLWATVDVCNPPSLPRIIGIRGSMPGTGLKNEEMFMRFQVEYQSAGDWKLIPGADSGFRDVGSAIYKARQSGQQFTIPAKVPYVLRGAVSFQWRRRGHAVLKAERITSAGHVALAGAEPPGYSAAACALP